MSRRVAVYVALCAAACGGGNKASGRDDAAGTSRTAVPPTRGPHDAGAPATPPGTESPYQLAPLDGDGGVRSAGMLAVRVSWPNAPATAVSSPGRTRCGDARAPALSLHHSGGVPGAVVWLERVAAGKPAPPATAAALTLRGCALSPGVVVAARIGAELVVRSDDERRQLVVVEELGDDAATPVARMPLAIVGQRFGYRAERAAILRARVDGEQDAAYVVVPRHPYYGVTDRRGEVELDELVAGRYELVVWHPPLEPGGAPLRRTRTVEVKAAERQSVEVSLAP